MVNLDQIESLIKFHSDNSPSAVSNVSVNRYLDGDKFDGGFGETVLYEMDYWTLRQRSSQLFSDNLYAFGLINRLVTNEINTGLTPECNPEETVLGKDQGSLSDWSEDVEIRFNLWCTSPELCDHKQSRSFGEIQREARLEALISGDVLVVNVIGEKGIPQIQLVSGSDVVSPLKDTDADIVHGVEKDKKGQHVAYWVRQDDGEIKRVSAKSKSGRLQAWLVYGTTKRMHNVRGTPLLGIVLQSLKEIDRYRDSTQRKAVINSIVAMFIKKGADKMGTTPMHHGAVRRGSVTGSDESGEPRQFNAASYLPGMVIDELQVGEEPVMKGGEGTDLNFGEFEQSIIQAVAWANEIPPEILMLSFSSNYSASAAAILEFRMYLNKVWGYWGGAMCRPVFNDWLINEVLSDRIDAPGLIEAINNGDMYAQSAWFYADWYGSIKPSTDMKKHAQASQILIAEGWSTNAREARILTGSSFRRNIKRLIVENEMKVEASLPLREAEYEGISDGEDVN